MKIFFIKKGNCLISTVSAQKYFAPNFTKLTVQLLVQQNFSPFVDHSTLKTLQTILAKEKKYQNKQAFPQPTSTKFNLAIGRPT
jgi:hypothetical protein